MPELSILVPTRSRPHNIRPILNAWYETAAFDDGAELVFLLDEDDSSVWQYRGEIGRDAHFGSKIHLVTEQTWLPMVTKLNRWALFHADAGRSMVGFMGDDHLPRTEHWVRRVSFELTSGGAGIVSSPDGYRPDDLPTWWAMRGDIIRTLGRMVPAPVQHLYCDNAVRDLAVAANCYGWLEDVLIEHMHPIAGKGLVDDQYRTVNSAEQYAGDRADYAVWSFQQLGADAASVIKLREATGG